MHFIAMCIDKFVLTILLYACMYVWCVQICIMSYRMLTEVLLT